MLRRTANLPVLAMVGMALVGTAGYILGSGGEQTAHAQAPSPAAAQAGTYQFEMVMNPGEKQLQAVVLDTRTGEVSIGVHGPNGMVWQAYLGPRAAK